MSYMSHNWCHIIKTNKTKIKKEVIATKEETKKFKDQNYILEEDNFNLTADDIYANDVLDGIIGKIITY